MSHYDEFREYSGAPKYNPPNPLEDQFKQILLERNALLSLLLEYMTLDEIIKHIKAST